MAHQDNRLSTPNLKPLPPSPETAQQMRQNGQSGAIRGAKRRLQALQQQGTSHLDARVAELFQLLEENSRLRDELAYIHQLQSANRKLLQDVCSISVRLRSAVLDYRAEQDRLDKEFIQRTQF
jgi:hypothetical protein